MAAPTGPLTAARSFIVEEGGSNHGIFFVVDNADIFDSIHKIARIWSEDEDLHIDTTQDSLAGTNDGEVKITSAGSVTIKANNSGENLGASVPAFLIEVRGNNNDGLLLSERESTSQDIFRIDGVIQSDLLHFSGSGVTPRWQLKLRAGEDSSGNAFVITNGSGTTRINMGVTEAGATAIIVLSSNVGGENVILNGDSTDSNRGLFVDNTRVVGPQSSAYGAPTGTATRTTFNTGTVTLSELAERVHALIDDLRTHGLLG